MHLPIFIYFLFAVFSDRNLNFFTRQQDKTLIFLLSKTPAYMSPVEFQKRTYSFCGQKILKSAKISANLSFFSPNQMI